MIKLKELLGDETGQEADNWVKFLNRQLDLDNLKEKFNAKYMSDYDLAESYYQMIDDIANEDPDA